MKPAIVVFFDASTRVVKGSVPARGPGAAAIVAYDGPAQDRYCHEMLVSLPEPHTVNENEYIGLITALEYIQRCHVSAIFHGQHFEIVGDSMVVTQQFRGKGDSDPWREDGTGKPGFACNSENLKPYLARARALYAAIRAFGSSVTVTHILRSTHPGNTRVDRLAQGESNRLEGKPALRDAGEPLRGERRVGFAL